MYLNDYEQETWSGAGDILAGVPADKFIVAIRDPGEIAFNLFVASLNWDDEYHMAVMKVTSLRAEARVFRYTDALDVAATCPHTTAKVVPL